MERKEAIRGAYRMTGGNSFYDGMITCSTLSGKAVCRLVWAMNKAENDTYLEKAMSGIPEHFSGKLLEVPVGTGILTMPVYQTMPEADITCLDYSADMMGQAQEKAERLHLKNVTFRQGDVGALSYADDTFDIVLSLNGFHAFPDKEAAYCVFFRLCFFRPSTRRPAAAPPRSGGRARQQQPARRGCPAGRSHRDRQRIFCRHGARFSADGQS